MATRDFLPQVNVNEITRIAVGAQIKQGVLISQSDIRIDGYFDGTIETSGKLVIGENAVVIGEVVSMGAEINGKYEGTIYSGQCVSLRESAIFKGTMNSVQISIEKGAIFDGTCKMISKEDFESHLSKSENNDQIEENNTEVSEYSSELPLED